MKFIILSILLPLVFGECPPAPEIPVVCDAPNLLCPGPTMPDGCVLEPWCLYVGENDPCPATCPVDCGVGFVPCYMGMDGNDCPMPDSCMPEGEECPPIPTVCPPIPETPECEAPNFLCPGPISSDGCVMPEWCFWVDENNPCLRIPAAI